MSFTATNYIRVGGAQGLDPEGQYPVYRRYLGCNDNPEDKELKIKYEEVHRVGNKTVVIHHKSLVLKDVTKIAHMVQQGVDENDEPIMVEVIDRPENLRYSLEYGDALIKSAHVGMKLGETIIRGMANKILKDMAYDTPDGMVNPATIA